MSIAVIQGRLSTYGASISSKLSAQVTLPETASKNEGRGSNTVNITDKAKQLAANTQAVNGRASLNIPSGEYPLEYYSIPQWQADLSPVQLSGKLGGVADEIYVKGGPLVGKYDSELLEYSKLLDSHFQALMKKEGINSLPEYHQVTIVDKESSERLRLLMKESIAGDKRMTELMNVLGIGFPG